MNAVSFHLQSIFFLELGQEFNDAIFLVRLSRHVNERQQLLDRNPYSVKDEAAQNKQFHVFQPGDFYRLVSPVTFSWCNK